MEFEEEGYLQKVHDDGDWVRCLRRYGGSEVRNLVKYLPDPPALADDQQETEYEKLVRKLNLHFVPQENKQHARYCFNKERPRSHESVASYAARLREKSEKCDFGANADDRILEHITQTISDQDLIKKSILKKWNLGQLLDAASKKEDISSEVQDMKAQLKVLKIGKQQRHYRDDNQRGRSRNRYRGNSYRHGSRGQSAHSKQDDRKSDGKKSESQNSDICSYCGETGLHNNKRDCPAYGKECAKCGRWNHLASCCQAGKYRPPSRNRYSRSRGR